MAANDSGGGGRQLRCAIYCRLSKAERQDGKVTTDAVEAMRRKQEDYLVKRAELEGWAVHKVYSDLGVSGGDMDRPGLNSLRDDASYRRFDIVLVHAVDRLARDTLGGLQFYDYLRDRHIELVSATQPIDTRTAMGRMLFRQLLNWAEFERDLTSERTKHALRKLQEAGKRVGRPPRAMVPVTEEMLTRMRTERMRLGQVMRAFGMGRRQAKELWNRVAREREKTDGNG